METSNKTGNFFFFSSFSLMISFFFLIFFLLLKDKFGALSLAIECYITDETVCSDIRDKEIEVRIILFPGDFSPNALEPIREFSHFPLISSLSASLKLQPFHTSLSPHTHTIITVQTFSNPLSGPSLYMFVVYYLSLGYGVIVYDMYGLHRNFLEEFIMKKEIDYHPITIFERIFRDNFNRETHIKHQVILFYFRDSYSVEYISV
jgi:hypothetical protein